MLLWQNMDLQNLEQILPTLTESEQEILLKEILKQDYKRSLYLTAKKLLGYQDINRQTHGGMIHALEQPTKRKLLCVPRGCFKSSIGVVSYSIWLLLNNPNLRILIDSEVYTNSKNFLREIKAHLESKAVTELFGLFRSDTNWTEGEITIKQRTRVFKEASITCSGIGAVKVGQHYDVIIQDDLNSGNNSQTIEGRKKVIDHYKMNTAILEPEGIMVVIGTRYSADDLIGHILVNEVEKESIRA